MTALDRALDRGLLECPHCRGTLSAGGAAARCAAGHSFDRARQGYLTLLGGRGRRFPGDSTDQVLSRERVFAGGWFDPVISAVAGAVPEVEGPTVLDVGAGTGAYLAAALEEREGALGLGTELSVPAARRLAKAHPAGAAVIADTWERLPVSSASVDVALVVFAPRNVAEFSRVLRPGGVVVVATPGPGHLEPLRSTAGMLGVEEGKAERLAQDFSGWELVGSRVVDEVVTLDRGAACDVVLMGPSGVHRGRDELAERLPEDLEARLHVEVRVFRAGGGRGSAG